MEDLKYDLVGNIIAFEDGSLSARDTIGLFSRLVESGTAWSLQGSYGRFAVGLILRGLLTDEGEITDAAEDMLAEIEEMGE